ncbi:hypothetical protein KKC88_04335, partial [Patescibacteria group bacterium]|nr:hypothetical protein [Patescibacteria group bacterium]
MHTNPRKFRKVIAGILLICLLGFVSLGVFVPQSAHAQLVVTDPSLLGKNIAAWVKQGWEKFRDNALALAYKNLLGTFLQQMAYDAATFIASGGQGQDSLVYSKPAGEYFRDLGDAAAGSAIEGFAEGMGFSQGLCMPPDDLLQIDIAYGLMTQFGSSPPPGPACTLSELAGNWSEAFADPEFETFINLYYDPQSNNLGNALAATTHIMETVATEEDNAKWQRLYEGGQFQSVTEDVSGWIQTPSSMIQQQILSTQAAEENKWGQYTGSILADTAGVFLNTLTSKLLQRLKDGMFNTVSGSSLASLMAGSTGGQVAGVTAAEEVYASLNKPSFIATGVYNVMNDFITCPPDPEQATIYNCVIGSSMQSAIDSRWTVQEYIDYLNDNGVTYKFAQDNISSPEEGLSVRAVTILKKFRVVPVGWQIAAEYVNSEIRLEEQSEYTLPQVMDAYDDCGSDPNSGNAYSPLCKLVDPYWVLKAPENYCGRESWTSDILYESFSDTDANPNTQEALELTRDTACVDERACIKENADGSCSAYGYCTEERRTYLFEGEACEEQNSSCQSFLTEDNEIASYLKNTINQDDCATNPGCKWYCQYTDTMGNFLCVDEDTVYETCNENSIDYVNDDGCVCDDTTTCEVPVNSGTNPQTGVLCVEGNDPDCNNTCLSVTPTPTLCELDDNCGADYPTFNPDTGTCTCTLTDDCEADIGDSSCDVVWGESCAIDGGACTEDSETYESIEYCTCTDPNDNTQACNIGMGDYFCDLDAGGQCYFPTTTEQPAVDDPLVPDLEDPDAPGFVWDIAINFDNDLESCDEDDATCNLYYRMVEGTNILPNAQFDYYEGNLNDNSSDFFGYCAENGSGCNDNASCVNGCNGWINSVNAQAIDISFNSDLSPEYGETAIYVPAGSGTLTNTIDTGRSVSNRTFTAAMRVMAFDDCVFEYSLSDDDGNHNSTYTDDNTYNLDANPGTWAGVTKTVTFPDNSNLGDGLTLSFNQCPGAEIALDLAQIEEADSFSAYSAYGESSASYLVQDELLECDMDDVGCELYTPVVGREEDAIPGLVTNPKSDVCTDGAYLPFQNPSCSQCPESQVGCDFYQEQPLTNITPLVDPSHGLGSERAGIIERTGYYCEDDMAQSCYDSSDCGGSACVPDLSLIPSSGQTCPAAQVGCEEYTNLDEVSAGGEGLEYYSYIRQCVKPDDTDIKTFYTWVGSDIAGYQLQSYLLKEAGDGTPCTVLDPGETDFNAGCYNNVIAANDCTAEFGIDPDCRQYYDANANVSYRYESEVVYVDEECTPMRAVLDDRTYYSIPTQSTTCSENNVGCREYKGTDAGNVEYLIDATFSGNITTGWENAESTSSEAIVQGDYSLSLSTSNPPITYELFTDVNGNISGTLEPGGSYMLTFWSKDGGGGGKIITGISGAGPTQYFTDNGSTTDINEADMGVTEDWRYYEFGPIILPADASVDDGDEFYFIENNAGDGYVDNIQLTTSSSQFLIKGSFITCSGYEGCRAYTDRAGDAHYLKSFIRLCREDMVGCEVLIDTFNSTNPFTQMWNTENEFQLDNVLVPHDMPKSYVYNPDAACIASSKGCTAMGLPELDMQTDFVDGYDTLYRLNDPDIYDELLCEEHQLQCEAYTSDFDGTMYFKNPGNKTCDWLQDDNGTFDWYKTGTDFEACPVRYEYDLPSQPIGSICNTNSGTKTGDFCTADGDCSPSDGSADSNQYPPRCISNLAEEVGIQGDLGYSDFGWVGNCAEDDSGCTTYNDSSSPNVTELIYNSSFEDDVRENTNNTYYEVTSDDPSYDSVRDHLPDYWSDPAGACPIENFIENTDEFFAGSKSLFLNDCTVYTANTIPVDRDKLYNLDGWFKGESDNFDLGLEYYDTNGALIESDDEVFATGQNYIPNNQFDQQTTYWDFSNYFGCIKWLGAQGYAQSGASFGYTMSYIQGTGCNITSDQFEVPSGEILEISAYMTPVGNTAEVFLGVSCYNDDFTDFNCVQHFETLAPNSWSEVSVTLGPPGSVAAGLADYETILSPMNRIEVRGGSGPGSNPANAPYLVAVDNFAVRTTNTYQSYQNDIAAQGASITTDDDWTYYYAHVGPGSINEFPAGTVSVRPYIANNSSADLYSDETSFKEVDQYHYLDYTVDGTQEHAQATGNSTCTDIDTDQGEINSGGGCVGFQDVLYYTENLHPQLQGECVQCVDGINDSDCYNLPNACNANSILKVTPDRVCNEWVACRTARVVENSDGTSEYTCFDLDQCTGMDDEGRCNDWDEKPAYSELSSETDLTFTTSAENNTDLDLMQNLTGYVKAGMVWPDLLMCVGGINAGDVCTTNTQCEDIGTCEFSPDDIISHSPPQAALAGFRCSGGSNNGDTCDPADLDACIGTDDGVCSAALQVEGYYPYGWMPEVGEDGVQSGDPLILGGDFEDLYCSGNDADLTMPCILDRADSSLLAEFGLDDTKGQCWLSEFEDWELAHGDGATPQYVCANSPNKPDYYDNILLYSNFPWVWPFEGWSGLLGDEQIRIWQYDNAYDPPNDVRVDINNVLQVAPTEGDYNSGVKYDLTNKIAQDGEYTLSLDARYVTAPGANETVNIGFRHENGEYDYFLKGNGMVDLVVLIDNTTNRSGSGIYDM